MGLDASTVTIKLDGVDRDLVCTIDSVIVMSRAYGGMMNLYERVKALDLDAFTVIIRAGLMLDGPEAEALMEKVWKTGLTNLMPGVAEFTLLAASGGVRHDDSDEAEGETGEPGKP